MFAFEKGCNVGILLNCPSILAFFNETLKLGMKIIGVRGSPISRENLFIAFSSARVQDYDFIAGIAQAKLQAIIFTSSLAITAN